MLSPKQLQGAKDSLFSLQAPMKKSFVISDVFLVEINESSRTIKLNKTTPQIRKSMMKGSKIFYPQSSFLVRKLKRILTLHLRSSFNKIKGFRKIIINFNLINNIPSRNLRFAFFCIQNYAHFHANIKLGKIIIRNKRPHLLFQAMLGVVRRKILTYFKLIQRYAQRKEHILSFLSKIQKIASSSVRLYFERIFIRQFKSLYSQQHDKLDMISKMFNIIARIRRNYKHYAFNKLLENVKIMQYDNVNEEKKNASVKLNSSSAERARILALERQKLRGIKNTFEIFSSDTSKARYEIRKDLNAYRNKIKDQEKMTRKKVQCLTVETENLSNQLEQSHKIFNKRKFRIEFPINQKLVEQIYKLLWSENANQIGEIKGKSLGKHIFTASEKEILRLEQFHLYKNQKLRQQIFQYQNLQAFSNKWPEQKLASDENQSLKQIIQCLIGRMLDKFIHFTNKQQEV